MNTLTLTPNQRLAATLIKRYNEEKITQGFACWPSADIRPFSSWIQELWEQVCAQRMELNRISLTADQELILWEEMIAAEPGSDQLLMLSDLAKQAQSAWTTLKLWRTRFDHPSFSFTENARHFQAWAEAFEQRCHEQDWIDRASLTDHLIDALRQTSLHLPQKLILLNFTELAPQYRELLAVCEKQGLSIEYQNLQQGRSQYQIKLIDEEQELQTVARWAKKILAEKPTARIGCIAADLEGKR